MLIYYVFLGGSSGNFLVSDSFAPKAYYKKSILCYSNTHVAKSNA